MNDDRNFAPSELTEFTVAPSDPKVQKIALKVLDALVKQTSLGDALAILTTALAQGFAIVLHNESPMPEGNIDSLHRLADKLKETIVEHEECARHLSRELRARLEPSDDDTPPTVH